MDPSVDMRGSRPHPWGNQDASFVMIHFSMGFEIPLAAETKFSPWAFRVDTKQTLNMEFFVRYPQCLGSEPKACVCTRRKSAAI